MGFTAHSVRWAVGCLAVVGLVGLAGCGDDDDDDSAATSTTEAAADDTTTTAADTTTTADAAAATTIETAESSQGTILVDGEGRALYLFMPDAQGASTCVDSCAGTWPPLEGPAAAGTGADEGLLATSDRPDGSVQVTYNGWPLYHFASDAAPGDTNGQGVGNVWYLVDAQGNAVTG
jgi:predicted lipoprotein with Yx(FWY)xxD motif